MMLTTTGTATSDDVVLMSRQQCIERCGIDPQRDRLVWKGWSVGGEICKTLVLRNVSTTLCTLTCELPETTAFYMDYPQPVRLFPGMTFSTSIFFRPTALVSYADRVKVTTNKGVFAMPLMACTPGLELHMPRELAFGFACIGVNATRHFTVVNSGALDAELEWSVPAPFRLEPQSATVPVGDALDVVCTYESHEASVDDVEARCVACSLDGVVEASYTLRLTGVGKYAHLQLEPAALDFGAVLSGTTALLSSTLRNLAPVPAKVTVDVDGDSTSFTLRSPSQLLVPPLGNVPVQVAFTPTVADAFDAARFELHTPGVTEPLVLQTCGRSDPRRLTLDSASIDFGDVEVGATRTRLLRLRNENAHVSIAFKFFGGSDGAFRVTPELGVLARASSVDVNVVFAPRDALNFYERVFCVGEHCEPLYVDVLGTSFDAFTRPAPFTQAQVDAYHHRCALGLAAAAPEEVARLLHDRYATAADVDDVDAMRALSTDRAPVFAQFMQRDDVIELLASSVQFGSCPLSLGAKTRAVRVHNGSDGKVVVVWDVPLLPNASAAFSVTPRRQELRPRQSAEFQISFRPRHDNALYACELAFTAAFKSNRSFRLVQRDTFTPSWRRRVQLLGNSFRASSEPFTPKFRWSRTRVCFPALRVGERHYTCVRLTNAGDTPLQFGFDDDDDDDANDNSVFAVRPSSGSLQAGAFTLLVLSFAPKMVGTFSHEFVCTLNNATRVSLRVSGAAQVPRLSTAARLVFGATSRSLVSSRTLTLTNASRIAARFRWRLPPSLQGVFGVTPLDGVVDGNCTLDTHWTFAPGVTAATGVVRHHVVCDVFHNDDDDDDVVQKLEVLVVGDCVDAGVRLETRDEGVDVVPDVVGCAARRRVWIVNDSDAALSYNVQLRCLVTPRLNDASDRHAAADVALDVSSGRLEGRAHAAIDVDYVLWRWGVYEYELHATADHRASDAEASEASTMTNTTLRLSFEAVLPQLRVVDVHLDALPSSNAWRLANVDAVNEELAADFSSFELSQRSLSLSSHVADLDDLLRQLRNIDCRMLPRVVGSDASVLSVRLANAGRVPLTWRFVYPLATEPEHELWTEPLPETDAAKELKRVIEHRLIEPSLQHGQLDVGAHVDVRVVCQHNRVGEPQLPLVLEVEHGKRLVWRFVAETTLFSSRSLTLLGGSGVYTLRELPIGLAPSDVPVQPLLHLYNRSATAVAFEVDTTPLEQLRRDNYGFDVLECLDTRGLVPANASMPLRFRFHPLEARRYDALINVRVDSGAVLQLAINGVGFHPRAARVPAARRDPPSLQLVEVRGQLACLEPRCIAFGTLPVRALSRRVAMLVNTTDSTLSFAFDDGGDVIVEPASGVLTARQRLLLRVTLAAGATPRFVQQALRCVVSTTSTPSRSCALMLEIEAEVLSSAPDAFVCPTFGYESAEEGVERVPDELLNVIDKALDGERVQAALQTRLPKEPPFFVHLPTAIVQQPDELYERLPELSGRKMERYGQALRLDAKVTSPPVASTTDACWNRVRRSLEFQELAADILDETLFNIMGEIAEGDFNLGVTPREIVTHGLEFNAVEPGERRL